MFVNKGKINTPKFPMLHHEESAEKPKYSNPPFPDNSPLRSPFSSKNFRPHPPPPHFHCFSKSQTPLCEDVEGEGGLSYDIS